MMDTKQQNQTRLLKTSVILAASIMLASCASHQAVPGAYSTSPQIPILAGAGAATGAVAAGTTAGPASIPVGAAIGGAAGGLAGYISNTSPAILKRLSAQPGVQVIAVGDTLKLLIFTDGCFDFGTSDITNRCTSTLVDVAALLKNYGNTPIKVAGYTDNGFGEALAQRLSQEQADSIVAFLWAHGIPHQRFTAKGYGSANSIATNYTVRGNSLNRRVEINVG